MHENPIRGVVRHIRRVAGAPPAAPSEDRQLLEQFLSRHDEGAFAVLVRRHGPMVLGVCRRLLRDPHDADDAFQAVFLVLLRKARSLGDRDLLAPWLYGVAYRTALKARGQRARRQSHERQAARPVEAPSAETPPDAELRALLDEEVQRLPEKYRRPVVLCYLQGATLAEAARELGWPLGTVAGRLARARERLRGRLTRRGVVLTAAAAEGALSRQTPAAVPASLVGSTVRGAVALVTDRGALAAPVAALMKGVLNAMFLTKLKIAALVVLSVGIVGGGTWVIVRPAPAAQQPEPQKVDPPPVGQRAEQPDVPPAPELFPKEMAFDEERVKKLVEAARVSDKLKTLYKDLHKAALDDMRARWQEFMAGRGTLDILLATSLRLLEAERNLSDKKEDQVAAFENHWRCMKDLEAVNQARFDAGRVAVADNAQTRFFRIQAEIWLERVRAK